MALFRNRPLALASIVLIVAVFCSFFLPTALLFGLFLVLGLALLALLALSLKKQMGYARFLAFLLVLAALIGTLRVSLDRSFVADPLASYMNQKVQAEVVVREITRSTENGAELLVDVKSIEGKSTNVKAIVRQGEATAFSVGDRVRARILVKPLDFDSGYDGEEYTYLGEGTRAIFLLEDESHAALIKGGENGIRAKLAPFRTRLSLRITTACQGEAGELLSAMLLGTRSSLSRATVRDFGRAGVSHLLALSGLHLTVLVGMIDRLLCLFRVDKRLRMIPVLLACFGYLALTGFNYSMIRAVVMLVFLYVGYLWRSDYDGMTALCFCAAAILLLSPTAVFSASFRMTFLATLGVLIVAEVEKKIPWRLPRKGKLRRAVARLFKYAVFSLVISSATAVTVLPVMWLTFGEISLMTPLSNLLLLPLAPIVLFAAILVLIFPIKPIAFIAGAVGRLVLSITSFFSLQKGMVSLQYSFVPYILIPLFLFTVILLFVDLKKRKYLLMAPALLAVVAFAVCLGVTSLSAKDEVNVSCVNGYVTSGAVIKDRNEYSIYDQTGTSESLYELYLMAEERCATEIESLVIGEYKDAQTKTLPYFCQKVMVRTLYLPAPTTDEERRIFNEICASAKEQGQEIILYYDGVRTPTSDHTSLFVAPDEKGDLVVLFAGKDTLTLDFTKGAQPIKEYTIRHESP